MKIGDLVKYKGINKRYEGKVVQVLEIKGDLAYVGYCDKKVWEILEEDKFWTTLNVLEPKNNDITSPDHYHRGGIDVIEFAKQNFSFEEVKGFFRINILKYTSRYDKKNNIDDLIKANDYIERLKEWEASK